VHGTAWLHETVKSGAAKYLNVSAGSDPLVTPAVAAEGRPGAIELICWRLPTTSASVKDGAGECRARW
jgi:hypothetical protein